MTLRGLRERSGMSQSQLSEATDSFVSQNSISQLELGKIQNPGILTVQALARALKTKIEVVAAAIAESVQEAA